jgi:peptidoglycan hydrolase CwlO-like protein
MEVEGGSVSDLTEEGKKLGISRLQAMTLLQRVASLECNLSEALAKSRFAQREFLAENALLHETIRKMQAHAQTINEEIKNVRATNDALRARIKELDGATRKSPKKGVRS